MFNKVFNELFGNVSKLTGKNILSRKLLISIGVIALGGFLMASTVANAEDIQPGIYNSAVSANQVANPDNLGLIHTKSVFIPARYAVNKQNALYLNGNRWFAPGGAGNVEGFINTASGYLVAVRQSGVSVASAAPTPGLTIDPKMFEGMTPDQKLQALAMLQKIAGSTQAAPQRTTSINPSTDGGLQVVFYTVALDGSGATAIGSVPYGNKQLAISASAIYVPQLAYGPNQVKVWNYVGYNATGSQVSGPQGVLFASPLPDGGWFTSEIVKSDQRRIIGAGLTVANVRTDINGSRVVVQSTFDRYNGINVFTSTTAIFVDTPTLSDSFRTGYVVRMYREPAIGNSSSDFNNVALGLFNVEYPTKVNSGALGDFSMSLGDAHSVPDADLYDLSNRLVLLGSVEDPLVVSQMEGKRFSGEKLSGIYMGLIKPNHTKSEAIPLFNLIGGGLNAFRSILANTGGNLTRSNANDAIGIITPKSQFVLFVEKLKKGTMPGFVPADSTVISDADARGFVAQFGLSAQ